MGTEDMESKIHKMSSGAFIVFRLEVTPLSAISPAKSFSCSVPFHSLDHFLVVQKLS